MNPPTPPRNPPSPFETIAALAKFSRIPECSPEFYQKHFDAIDLAGGMVGWMGSLFKPLAQGLAVTGAPLDKMAQYIEVTLQGAKLTEWDLQSLDNNMEQAALKLLPVLKDPDFPAYMEECRWPIEGMFEEN